MKLKSLLLISLILVLFFTSCENNCVEYTEEEKIEMYYNEIVNSLDKNKCMGYKTIDVVIMVSIQLLIIIAASFIIGNILSIFTINIFNYYLQEYINISFNFTTLLNQIVILIIECFFVCLFCTMKVKKINLAEN
ncbi:ABC transporter permease [Sedimentibacter hydroxybenzoicus DSM 7310]|uniref:ABC transporter permease n=1 Tax=Sedimentibacter hydroxybenzoicus DSM 7310 TaxID=1123245 RepID=A0A974GVC2_SEDHY|nr:ABC transporter permease [Sedimentibacter hydroxybenzoicus]NYB73222.1 ABC transporter permease [Sedimentibacter hydroxybenzoicus DSM 7310]